MHMLGVAHISGAGENGAWARLSVLISLTFLCGRGQSSADARAGARRSVPFLGVRCGAR